MADVFKPSVANDSVKPSKWALLVGDVKVNGRGFAVILLLQVLTYAVFGTENSLVPLMASDNFHVPGASKTLVVLVMYGIFKAVAGLIVPIMNGYIGRHNVHRLGWLFFIPNPFMIWFAQDWETIIAAYAFLGFSQGLCSCTDNQFVQQLIPNSQGFASGIYETLSYISLAVFGVIAAQIVHDTGSNRPGPQQLALGLTLLALLVTIVMPKQDDAKEAAQDKTHVAGTEKRSFFRVFVETSLLRRVPAMSCLAGVMIQVAVGLAWTLLPLYFKSLGLKDKVVLASIATTFNAIRGVIQLFSGTLSDFMGARLVTTFGFSLCGISFILSAAIPNNHPDMGMPNMISLWVACAALLGIGVGTVYPVIPAQVGKSVSQQDRDVAISTFRFWRELGYALGGGISVTILTEQSVATCVIIIGALLLATALVLVIFYGPEKAPTKVNKNPEEVGLSPRDRETDAVERGARN
jgi:MFS family permease